MAAGSAANPVDDWKTVPADDWQTVSPAASKRPTTLQIPAGDADSAWKAAVHGNMLGIDPGTAYKNRDEVDKQLRAVGGDYDSGDFEPTIMNDIRAGWEDSILGMLKRNKLGRKVRNPGLIDKAITGVTQLLADFPVMIAGGAVGAAAGSEIPYIGNVIGAGAGAFALPAVMRQTLVEGISRGDVTSFSDILHRVGRIAWAGTKGAVTGAATEAAGGIPVGGLLAKSKLGSAAVKGLYQATALTTAADLLDGRLPTSGDFAGNAALIVPLNLITHGTALRHSDVERATMDVYAKDGTTPEETATKLAAQPPVKMDLPEGLRPAIQVGEGHIEGEVEDNHNELAARILSQNPITMEALEADPAKADDVLENPVIHDQDVIDRAWEIKKDAVDRGGVKASEDGEKPTRIEDLYDRASMKSGRGFSTPDGRFLSRMEARSWIKENEPDTHEMWQSAMDGDKQAELHSEDYAEARNRVQGRTVAEGDPVVSRLSPQNARRLAATRADLNRIKAGDASEAYGKEVVRTSFVGQRDARIAATTQLRDTLAKLIPDFHDQEALSILRDYKDDPAKLAADLEEIRNGTSDRMKKLIPSIERALNPSAKLLEADKALTGYYGDMLEEGRQLGTLDSTIDPANYTPHIYRGVEEAPEKSGVGRSAMTKNSPFAKERKYRTILDALKTEKLDSGAVNALDALSIRGESHAVTAATKILEAELRNTEIGKYGSASNHPQGWVELAPGQRVFRNDRAITDSETGESHIISQALYVPKDVADALKPILEQDVISQQKGVKALKAFQGFTKSLELGLSVFHMKALTITAMNNMSFADFTRSLASDLKSPAFASAEREAAADGLVTSKSATPYEAYQGLKESSIKESFDVRRLPGIKQIDAISQALTRETFDVIQRKFKVQDFSLKAASWMAKHPEATDAELFAARRSIAKEVNSAYGGLNWEVMGVSKNMRALTQAVMLAPDWTFSNVANLKYARQGGPGGAAARMFWVKSFATGIAMTQATSIAIGGKMSDHPTEVYMGKDKDGKPIYSNLFFAGAPKDAISMVSRIQHDGIEGLAEFMVSKLGPIFGTLTGLAFNKDGRGKPISKRVGSHDRNGKEYTRWSQLRDQAEFIGGKSVPITVKTVIQMLYDKKPDGTPIEHSMMEYMGAIAGATTTHEGAPGGGAAKESVIPGAGKSGKGIKLPGQSSKKFSIRSAR